MVKLIEIICNRGKPRFQLVVDHPSMVGATHFLANKPLGPWEAADIGYLRERNGLIMIARGQHWPAVDLLLCDSSKSCAVRLGSFFYVSLLYLGSNYLGDGSIMKEHALKADPGPISWTSREHPNVVAVN